MTEVTVAPDRPAALLPDEALPDVYAALLDGRVAAIGWGAVSTFPYYAMNSPFPLRFLIDSDPAKWGTSVCGIPIRSPEALADEAPDTVVVIVFPVYSDAAVRQILERLAAFGPYRAMPPFRSERDAAMLRAVAMRHCGALPEPVRAALEDPPGEAMAERLRAMRALLPGAGAPTAPRRVRLVIGSLQPGGAERQICYLAAGLKERGWDVAVLAFAPTQPGAEHYEAMLDRAGVPLVVAPSAREVYDDSHPDDGFASVAHALWPLLRHLPYYVVHWTIAACQRFAIDRPALVIAYLDMVNLAAGLGAVLAGVDRVLLSGRNVHPGNFPNHYGHAIGWMESCYRLLTACPEVRLSANSAAGARSYADWLGLPRDCVAAVSNGIAADAERSPDPDAVQAVRAAAGAAGGTPLIVGVFRLAEEKRPLLFVDTIRCLLDRGIDARAVLAGDGPMAGAVRDAVARAGLCGRLFLLGVREDVRAVIAAADLVLHVARAEGHPNVLMEAQLLGRPIVAAEAEGLVEVIAPVHRPQLCAIADAERLAALCAAVLADGEDARRRAAGAASWVAGRFSIANLVTNTLAGAGIVEAA